MAMHIARTLAQLEALMALRTARSLPVASLATQLVGMVGRWALLAGIAAGVVGVIFIASWLFP